MVQISEVKGNNRDNRTAAHTHIKGLGLNTHGIAEKQAAGFVGQTTAREVRNYGNWQKELQCAFDFSYTMVSRHIS